ncbi:MAG TPA: urocanate hydratase [Terriglobia bacterium]|nr:urocanate hydratase [Terriglobia bacterium]
MEKPGVKFPLNDRQTLPPTKPIHVPTGKELSCKGWHQEAALRMLMNSLDPAVAERPEELITRGRTGRVARDWPSFYALVEALENLGNEKSLLVQSGKPVGVFLTHQDAPRVLIVDWSQSETQGLVTYKRAALGSWTSIGMQGALLNAYQTLAAAARKHWNGDLAGRLVVSGGMGETGGALALAATLNGAAFLGVEVNQERITRCIRAGFCDYCVTQLDEALRILKIAIRKKQPVSVGLVGNCAEIIPELARRGVLPDLLTDQTGADSPLQGYLPAGLSLEEAERLRSQNPKDHLEQAYQSIAQHVTAMLELQRMGAVIFDFGNNLRAAAFQGGAKDAFEIPGFMSEYIRPLICEGRTPLRWVALSGDPTDISRVDDLLLTLFPEDDELCHWIQSARNHVRFQGLPARAAWLSREQGIQLGEEINSKVGRGELVAPLVLAHDLLDCASAASPGCETESVGDAVADWPLLHALLHTASGASWVALQGGGGTGRGTSLCSTDAIVADGSAEMRARLQRVLDNELDFALLRFKEADCDAQ